MNFDGLSQGVALLLNLQGVILRVLYDSLSVSAASAEVTSLTQLVDRQSIGKALSFLLKLRTEGVAFDWEMGVPADGGVQILHFAGVVQEQVIVVIGGRDRLEVSGLYEGMVRINSEQMNALRVAVKASTDSARQRSEHDSELYEELTRVNNTLVNLQRELAKKNAELARLDELKNQFLGMAAHDLRNPLAAILTYSEFMISDPTIVLGDDGDEFVQAIRDSSQFMLNLVTNLLDISTIESGQLQLNLEIVDLVALVSQNVNLNRALAEKKQISLRFDSECTAQEMLLDPFKIQQVLSNLISNAIKYSFPGSAVRVQLVQEGGDVVVSVLDQGQGIPEAERGKLFQYFGRTSVSSTNGERSTGLGLAIARNIVEGHGGQIDVESEVGVGSKFWFSLPIGKSY